MQRDRFSNYVPGLYFSAYTGFKSVDNDSRILVILRYYTKALESPVDLV